MILPSNLTNRSHSLNFSVVDSDINTPSVTFSLDFFSFLSLPFTHQTSVDHTPTARSDLIQDIHLIQP